MKTRHRTLAAVLAALIGGCAILPREPAIVTVTNRAAATVTALNIDVGTEHLQAFNLAPGAAVTLHYTIGPEADYRISVRFATGKEIMQRVGYVDAGYTTHDYLSIHSDYVADDTGPGGKPLP